MNARVLLKGLGLILSLALLGYLFNASDLGNSINESWIDARIRGHGVEGTLLFLMMGAIFTAVGLPRQIIAFLGGYAFGLLSGTLLATLAALLGCMITFSTRDCSAGACCARDWVRAPVDSTPLSTTTRFQ